MTDDTRDAQPFTEIARAVCDVLPGDVTAACVAMLLHEHDDATAADLGRLLRKDAATVRRARKRLADVGLLRAHTSVTAVPARDPRRAETSATDGSARRSRGRASSSSSSLFPSGTSADAESDAALDLTRRVFATKQPRPATPFPGVMAVARKLIDAGWSVSDVFDACCYAPTISVASCEVWLNTRRKPKRAAVADDDARRAGPSGKVAL